MHRIMKRKQRPGHHLLVLLPSSAARALRGKALGRLYSAMQSAESKLGGGEGVEGLYGSITRTGTQEVLDCLALHACLCEDSVLVDIGAGLARPLLHAAVSHGVQHSFGIELDQVKCDKAFAFVERCLTAVRGGDTEVPGPSDVPRVLCAPVEGVATLTPATHAYTFWEGVCSEARCAVGALFAASETLGAISCIQRSIRQDPVEVLQSYGFGDVKLVATCSVAMSGSGRRFTAYTFVKEGWTPPCSCPGWISTVAPLSHESRIALPPKKETVAVPNGPPEVHVKVHCNGQDAAAKGNKKSGQQGLLTSSFRASKARSSKARDTIKPEEETRQTRSRSGRLIAPAARFYDGQS